MDHENLHDVINDVAQHIVDTAADMLKSTDTITVYDHCCSMVESAAYALHCADCADNGTCAESEIFFYILLNDRFERLANEQGVLSFETL